MKKVFLFTLFFLLAYSAVIAQRVSAYQAGSYQPALMNVRDLAPPGAGLYFIDYNYWNNSTTYVDRDGNEVNSLDIDLSPINPDLGIVKLDLEQQVSGYTNVPVLFYTSKFKILGARYMASVAPLFMSSNFRMNVHLSDTSVTSTTNTGGYGDMAFSPLGLGWSFGDKVDLSFFYTLYAPTGRYENGASDNLGKGYWTHQFQMPFYLYFMEKATALFVMPTFETNAKVEDSDVRPGNRLTIEYGISQYVTPWLELEVLNGHNWQISEDTGRDIWWENSPLFQKDRTSSVSFGVGVWPWEGRLNMRVKYSFDYNVRQRYKSNFWSFSVIFIPNLLTEKG